jgi:hypothetical protein
MRYWLDLFIDAAISLPGDIADVGLYWLHGLELLGAEVERWLLGE